MSDFEPLESVNPALRSLLLMEGLAPLALLDGDGRLRLANRAAAAAWDARVPGAVPRRIDDVGLARALAQVREHPDREVVLDLAGGVRLRAAGATSVIVVGAAAGDAAAQRWQFALDGSDDGLWDWNIASGTVYFSTAWKAQLGYADHELIDDPIEWEQRVHPEDRASTMAALRRHLDGLDPQYNALHRLRHRDGSWRWVLARAKVVAWDSDGRPVRIVGTHRDVTEEREALLALERTRAQMHDFIAAMPALAFVLGPDGTVLQTNQAWDRYQMQEAPADSASIVGANYLAVCDAASGTDGAEGPQIAAGIRSVIDARAGEFALVYPCHAPEMQRWFDLRVVPLPGPAPRSVVVWHLDVTSRVVAGERLQRIAEHVPGMIYQYRLRDDGTSHFPYASEGVRTIYGVTPEQVMDDAAVVFGRLHVDDLGRVAESIQVSAQTLVPWRCEYRVWPEAGREIWVEGYATPRRERGAVAWYGYITDITQRKLTELSLAKAMTDLAASNRDLEDFAAIASHDLKEPLRKIQLLGGRLSAIAPSLDAEQRDYLARMSAAAGRMGALIDDLLVYARAGAEPVERSPVALDAVVAQAMSDLLARMEASGAEVDVGPLPTVPGNPGQLRQVFLNLVGNALKFTVAGRTPRISIKATAFAPRTPDKPPSCEISVCDNGIGFDASQAAAIFAPFRRLHGREAFEGTGIGLAIVRRVVERHGGQVVADGRPGQGACFRVRLPLLTVEGS
jgi:PAS domain S-box-containing protein